MTESEFQQAVLELAAVHHWMAYHPEKVQARYGARNVWTTAGSNGFPDLVLCHPGRGVIFAELKSARGRLSTDQTNWIGSLTLAGAECYVWRPADLPQINDRLSGNNPAWRDHTESNRRFIDQMKNTP